MIRADLCTTVEALSCQNVCLSGVGSAALAKASTVLKKLENFFNKKLSKLP